MKPLMPRNVSQQIDEPLMPSNILEQIDDTVNA